MDGEKRSRQRHIPLDKTSYDQGYSDGKDILADSIIRFIRFTRGYTPQEKLDIILQSLYELRKEN